MVGMAPSVSDAYYMTGHTMSRLLTRLLVICLIGVVPCAIYGSACVEVPAGTEICDVQEARSPNPDFAGGLTLYPNAGVIGDVPPGATSGDLWLGDCDNRASDPNTDYCVRFPDNSRASLSLLATHAGRHAAGAEDPLSVESEATACPAATTVISNGVGGLACTDTTAPLLVVGDIAGVGSLTPGMHVSVDSSAALYAWAHNGTPPMIGFGYATGAISSPAEPARNGDAGGLIWNVQDGDGLYHNTGSLKATTSENWGAGTRGLALSLSATRTGTELSKHMLYAGGDADLSIPSDVLLDLSAADPNSGPYGLRLAQTTGCTNATGAGIPCWNGTDLYVGSGAAPVCIGGATCAAKDLACTNCVALTTETTGDYVASGSCTAPLSCTATGEGSTPTWALSTPLAATYGGTGVADPNEDSILVGAGTSWFQKAVPSCSTNGAALRYNTTTDTFTCNGPYSGTGTCTNQFARALNASNAPTCATVALGTDTSGNYAAGDDVAGKATSGDSATSFFGSGTLETTVGGTGLGTYAQGDLLYASAANTLSALSKDATATRYLSNTGTTNNPAWAQVALATGVSGALPLANLADDATANKCLVSGAAGDPSYHTCELLTANNHAERSGTTPTLDVCGTSPSVVGVDEVFALTVGTSGGGVTACSVLFANAFSHAPVCICNDVTDYTAFPHVTARSTTVIDISFATDAAGDTVECICMAYS